MLLTQGNVFNEEINPGSQPWTDEWKWPKAEWSRKQGREKGLLNLCSLQILLISNKGFRVKSALLNAEITLFLLLSRNLAWDCAPFLRFDLSDLCFLPWPEDRGGAAASIWVGCLAEMWSLWILHQGPLGTHFGRNKKTESIASIMLSCRSLESSLQPDCEIRGLGIETRINLNKKLGFCYITSFHHCLPRACGLHNRSLPGSLF